MHQILSINDTNDYWVEKKIFFSLKMIEKGPKKHQNASYKFSLYSKFNDDSESVLKIVYDKFFKLSDF